MQSPATAVMQPSAGILLHEGARYCPAQHMYSWRTDKSPPLWCTSGPVHCLTGMPMWSTRVLQALALWHAWQANELKTYDEPQKHDTKHSVARCEAWQRFALATKHRTRINRQLGGALVI